MSPIVRSYTDFQFNGSVVFGKDLASFPDNPRPGTACLKDGALWIYTTIAGIQTWYPLTNKKNSYVHTQGLDSFQWNVVHNLGSLDVLVGVFDETGSIAYPNVTVVDSNTVRLNFSTGATGRAIVFADGELFTPSINANTLTIAGGSVLIDGSGITIGGIPVLTTASIDSQIAAAVATKADVTSVYTKTAADLTFEPRDSRLQSHIGSTANPHETTKAQVGLGNVDNTADAVKSVASAGRLTVPRLINGVAFDGSADITVSAVDATPRVASELVGAVGGVASLGADGKVPASQLPVSEITASGVTSALGYTPVNPDTIGTDLIPASTQVFNIGSPTRRWKGIYVDEAHLSVNTLYLGDTPILGTSQDVVQIHADTNQGINISTKGLGQTILNSQAATVISTSGTNADVQIQASGQGSTVRMTSPVEVRMTAPIIAAYGDLNVQGATALSGSLTVLGNLNVQGTAVTLNTTNTAINDSVVTINRGEVGDGVSLRYSGIQVDRGGLSDARLVWDETIDKFVVGLLGAETPLSTAADLTAAVDASAAAIRAEVESSLAGITSALNSSALTLA